MSRFWILIAIFLGACSHAKKDFASSLENRQCLEARKYIPQTQPLNRVSDSVSLVARNAAAFSYVGLNYGAEVLIDTSAVVGMTIVLCSPYLMAAAFSNTSPGIFDYSSVCLPWPQNAKIFSPPLGRNAMKSTQSLRCPNTADYSQSLELIADCHESLGNKNQLRLALDTLDEIQSEKYFIYCTDFAYQQYIAQKRELVQHKLDALKD